MTTQYTKNFRFALPDFRMGPWHDLVNGDFSKIDALIYGALSAVDTLPWANNTHYKTGVSVLDGDDGTTWMNTVEHTSAATGTFKDDRTAHPTYWTQLLAGFAPRGEWANNTDYFPYDLAYQSSTGVLALCKSRHHSNASGTILDDEAYWSFLVNFSDIAMSTAIAVSYTPSGNLTATNVQGAIDQAEGQIIALNNVNVTQGTQITALQTKDTTHESRMTSIESVNTTQGSAITSLQAGMVDHGNAINSILTNKPNTVDVVKKAGDTMTGELQTPPSQGILMAGPVGTIRINSQTSGWACMSFLVPSSIGANFGMGGDGNFYYGGWSFGSSYYRLWSTRDFASVPQPGVTNMRLVYATDIWIDMSKFGAGPQEVGGAVMSGMGIGTSPATGDGAYVARYRYVQYLLNGGWYTAGFA